MKKKHVASGQPYLFDESDFDDPPAAVSEVGSPSAKAAASPMQGIPSLPKSRPEAGDLVVVVDSHSLIYQVFHAMPAMTGPDGIDVGAVHGFLRDLADLREKWKPDFLICAFDESENTFRNELFDQYKAHRDPMPEGLRAQLPIIHEAVETLDIAKLSISGFEADDILATIAASVDAVGGRCLLVTSDKDCRQLLTDRVQMLNIRKSELFGAEQLQEVWGITPSQVVDFQAMVGDSVDNVPGVPQIGPKAAQQLLAEFGSLEAIYKNLDNVGGAKRQETLRNNHDQALLSQQLVRLRNDVPIHWDWQRWGNPSPAPSKVESMFNRFGFRRLAERFAVTSTASVVQPPADLIDRSQYRCATPNSFDSTDAASSKVDQAIMIREATSIRPVYQSLESLRVEIQNHYRQIPESERWLSIDTETTSLSARNAEPVGYSISWAQGQAAYLPVRGPQTDRLLDSSEVNNFLRELLEDPTIQKIGQNIKYDLIVLRGQDLKVDRIAMDTMVADYLLEPGGRNHNLDELAKRHLGHETITIDTLIGSGKDQRSMASVDVDRVAIYAAEDVDIPFRLRPKLLPQLQAAKLENVFTDIELPLIEVLAEMEFNGIAVNTERLAQLSSKFEEKIAILRAEIMELADEDFNPDSPKQLANILFNKLGLRVVKKTKTGPSTDVEVLLELASEHPLPAKIVEYRQATKLKGTYIDALPRLVSPKTGRIHTSFRQDIAATGRLSSSEPNLQNIPVRTEDGRAIRSAFRPGPDNWLLMTADYSQIELRVLAHYCGDASLRSAFENDEDVHARVAAEVHGVSVADVTSAMRRGAKAINFGILYGQSPFGLAKALGISKADAAIFIDTYFDRYKSVREFMRETLEACRRDGYVKTISGRKRFLKGIRDFASLNPQQQKTLLEPERMAVNTVIQGSAADMIKIAMIRVYRRLQAVPLQAKLLLQIHDELVFEVAPEHVSELAELVRTEMIEAVAVDVPLKVDIKVGQDWSACEIQS
ncbi:MAG: DNA polymerase I [Pirellulaceae bacterium]|nr:DNA polymerase I [Pirellulaceae bacterium]